MFFSRTLFCSLRPQVLTEIGSVLFDRRSQRNSVPFPSSARSKQNSVLSRSAESQQNSVLFSWAAASQRNSVLFTRAADSQRNSVLFPDGRVPTEPGSVHPGRLHLNGTRFCSPGRQVLNGTQFCSPGQLHLNGTRFCSPGRPILNGTQFPDIGRSINYNNFPFLACHLQRREASPYGRPIGRFGSFCKFAIYDARKIFHFCIVYLQIYTTSIATRPRTGFVPVKQYCLLPSKSLNPHSCHCFFTVYK